MQVTFQKKKLHSFICSLTSVRFIVRFKIYIIIAFATSKIPFKWIKNEHTCMIRITLVLSGFGGGF